MKLKNLPGVSLLLVGTMLLASCSIKEDREECPCLLDVTFDGYCHEPLSALFLDTGTLEAKASYNNVLFDSTTGLMSIHDACVPRSQLLAVACSGVRNNNFDGRNVMIPLGAEMDSVSSAVKFLDARMERKTLNMTLGKQFCRLKIVFLDETFSSALRISGNVSGLDVVTGTPVQGLFSYEINESPYTINVPRQSDNSLVMDIVGEPGQDTETLPLGKYISATGYSWKSESLSDCTVLVDRAKAEISILINDWEEGGKFSLKY